MCGRYTNRANQKLLEAYFEVQAAVDFEHVPRYNIAPTQQIPIVRGSELCSVKWGLIPFWAKEAKIGATMINARGETITEKRSFQKPFAERRCLIPADGYYEWQAVGKAKQPYLFHLHDDGLFAFAGLWESNREFGESATIITTHCNEATAAYHDRMPVILDRADWAVWLGQSSSKEQLLSLIKPAPVDLLSIRTVSTLVNSPKNQTPECVAALR